MLKGLVSESSQPNSVRLIAPKLERKTMPEDKKYVVGIDPSLTGTAVCKYFEDGTVEVGSFGSRPTGDSITARVDRYLRLISRVIKFIGHDPSLITIEGYSFGSRGRQNSLSEYGGILRADLCEYDSPIWEVPPKTLKKFVTGSGNASKIKMVTATIGRWKVEYDTDDEYDAYGLARMAAAIHGFCVPETEHQVESLTKLTGKIFTKGKAVEPTPQPVEPPF